MSAYQKLNDEPVPTQYGQPTNYPAYELPPQQYGAPQGYQAPLQGYQAPPQGYPSGQPQYDQHHHHHHPAPTTGPIIFHSAPAAASPVVVNTQFNAPRGRGTNHALWCLLTVCTGGLALPCWLCACCADGF